MNRIKSAVGAIAHWLVIAEHTTQPTSPRENATGYMNNATDENDEDAVPDGRDSYRGRIGRFTSRLRLRRRMRDLNRLIDVFSQVTPERDEVTRSLELLERIELAEDLARRCGSVDVVVRPTAVPPSRDVYVHGMDRAIE